MNLFENPKLINCPQFTGGLIMEPGSYLSSCEIFSPLQIGYKSYMNGGILRKYVEIGRYCSIGRDVKIGLGHHALTDITTSGFFKISKTFTEGKIILDDISPKRRVLIGNDVWIGDNVMIKSKIRIGDGAVIGAGSMVTKDVEPYTVVAGVPARVIKMRFPKHIVEGLLKLKWWEKDPTQLRKITLSHNIKKDMAEMAKIEDIYEPSFIKMAWKPEQK